MNAWLTSVFSVGLISAAGVVLAFRIALRLSGGAAIWPAFWTAIAFGFGTLFFPFATLLFDHDVTASFLVAAFYLLFHAAGRALCLSGGAAGGAGGDYELCRRRAGRDAGALSARDAAARWARAGDAQEAAWYGLGLLGPLAAICVYNKACYGSPFALSNAFQNPTFIDKGPVFLGMFGVPDPAVALILLISPFRGIFYGAPILAMGVYGLWRMRRAFARGDVAVHRHRAHYFTWSIAPSMAGTPGSPAGRGISSPRPPSW